MNTSIYTTADIKKIVEPVFKSYGVRSAVLFGSYSKGEAAETSDVDILVDSGLRGLSFVGLIEDLRLSLNKDVDIIDISHIQKGSTVEQEIQNTGVTIYEE